MDIAQHIADRSLTVSDVARRANLPVSRVSEIVSGDEASLSEIRKISKAIRVQLQQSIESIPLKSTLFSITTENKG